MDRLTQLIPTPRTVRLGGHPYQVWPATLRDLCDLQAWIESDWIDPVDGLYARLFGAEGLTEDERLELIRAAYDVAEEGPPRWDEARGWERLATAEGLCCFTAIALRRGHPDLAIAATDPDGTEDRTNVVAIVNQMTAPEYASLRRAFYGTDSVRELEIMLAGNDVPQGQTITIGEAIDEVSRTHKGWTYDTIYGLTLAEFGNARRNGKPSESLIASRWAQTPTQEQWDQWIKLRTGKTPRELFPESPNGDSAAV